jgi:hypothetical protein
VIGREWVLRGAGVLLGIFGGKFFEFLFECIGESFVKFLGAEKMIGGRKYRKCGSSFSETERASIK